ncbi:L-carnitine dehydratase/bile acid-inducible protein F (plasmid) [Cupriavidus necator]|uniref:CaiB/BaiF CoA transferase family protein n=1 Tax=Cupriavidus necator TaxID=106590 RepID=UPI003F73A038
MGILKGITVIELCEVYQGPLAGQTLGDFGARVIKIERGPLGDPMRGGDFHARARGLMSCYFAAANRNKESVCLDLKAPAGKEALRELVKTADILLHNYRPGVMEKLGFGYEALVALNPRLIYAAASGYGETGPMAGMAGQDIVIQSFSGLAANGLTAQGQPHFVNAPLTDYASGMLLVQGILLALLERAQSGKGQKVSISLLDTAVSMQSLEAASTLNYDYETRWLDRALNFTAQASDGWVTVLGFFRDNPLQSICQALEFDDLSVAMNLPEAEQQLVARDAIVERLAPAFLQFTAADIVARLQNLGILAAPILGLKATLNLPQVASNGMIRTVPAEGQQDMQVIDHPLRLSRTPHAYRSGPPGLGEHTAAVLSSLGFDEAMVKAAAGAGN